MGLVVSTRWVTKRICFIDCGQEISTVCKCSAGVAPLLVPRRAVAIVALGRDVNLGVMSFWLFSLLYLVVGIVEDQWDPGGNSYASSITLSLLQCLKQ